MRQTDPAETPFGPTIAASIGATVAEAPSGPAACVGRRSARKSVHTVALLWMLLGSVVSTSAYAQDRAAGPAPDDARVNQLIVYGSDACPPGNEDEIIVCARLPEEERFRIPPPLRDRPGFGGRTWHDRAIELSYAGRSGIGSCTPSGAGGFIGCQNQLISQARAERRAEQDINWARLVAEARADRSRRIDRDAAAIERSQDEDE